MASISQLLAGEKLRGKVALGVKALLECSPQLTDLIIGVVSCGTGEGLQAGPSPQPCSVAC